MPLMTLATVIPIFIVLPSRVFRVIEMLSRAIAYTPTLKHTARRPERSFDSKLVNDITITGSAKANSENEF